MLHEIQNVRQIPEEGFRRWFSNEYFDLIVWYDQDREIRGFQLCYDLQGYERALTWKRNEGFQHNRIDSGEGDIMVHKRSPILVMDGLFDKQGISKKFRERSGEIDKEVADFVYDVILAYA